MTNHWSRMAAQTVIVIALALGLSDCQPFIDTALKALASSTQTSSAVGHAIDLAETGATIYFARHPNPEQATVRAAVQSARAALAVYDAAVRVGKGEEDADAALRAAYGELRGLLVALGVTSATSSGGAEAEAPLPIAFEMPEVDTLMGANQ